MANGFKALVTDASWLKFAARDALRAAVKLTGDAGFNEADHPREGGKFAKTKQEHQERAKHHEMQAINWQPHVKTTPNAQEYMTAHTKAAAAHREAASRSGGMSAENASKTANQLSQYATRNAPPAPK